MKFVLVAVSWWNSEMRCASLLVVHRAFQIIQYQVSQLLLYTELWKPGVWNMWPTGLFYVALSVFLFQLLNVALVDVFFKVWYQWSCQQLRMYPVSDEWMSVVHWWNNIDRTKQNHLERNLTQCHSVDHKSHIDWPWVKWLIVEECFNLKCSSTQAVRLKDLLSLTHIIITCQQRDSLQCSCKFNNYNTFWFFIANMKYS